MYCMYSLFSFDMGVGCSQVRTSLVKDKKSTGSDNRRNSTVAYLDYKHILCQMSHVLIVLVYQKINIRFIDKPTTLHGVCFH